MGSDGKVPSRKLSQTKNRAYLHAALGPSQKLVKGVGTSIPKPDKRSLDDDEDNPVRRPIAYKTRGISPIDNAIEKQYPPVKTSSIAWPASAIKPSMAQDDIQRSQRYDLGSERAGDGVDGAKQGLGFEANSHPTSELDDSRHKLRIVSNVGRVQLHMPTRTKISSSVQDHAWTNEPSTLNTNVVVLAERYLDTGPRVSASKERGVPFSTRKAAAFVYAGTQWDQQSILGPRGARNRRQRTLCLRPSTTLTALFKFQRVSIGSLSQLCNHLPLPPKVHQMLRKVRGIALLQCQPDADYMTKPVSRPISEIEILAATRTENVDMTRQCFDTDGRSFAMPSIELLSPVYGRAFCIIGLEPQILSDLFHGFIAQGSDFEAGNGGPDKAAVTCIRRLKRPQPGTIRPDRQRNIRATKSLTAGTPAALERRFCRLTARCRISLSPAFQAELQARRWVRKRALPADAQIQSQPGIPKLEVNRSARAASPIRRPRALHLFANRRLAIVNGLGLTLGDQNDKSLPSPWKPLENCAKDFEAAEATSCALFLSRHNILRELRELRFKRMQNDNLYYKAERALRYLLAVHAYNTQLQTGDTTSKIRKQVYPVSETVVFEIER
ncbi:hypothetical protein NMY22_g10001 [Coprinellus aureogranulatus]|nr:hypothetical protein NMY22_g10001 [Coprinellus aureogranulatus]